MLDMSMKIWGRLPQNYYMIEIINDLSVSQNGG